MKNVSDYEKPKNRIYERFLRSKFAEGVSNVQDPPELKAAKTLTSLSFSYLAIFLVSTAENLLNSAFFKSIGNKRINTMLVLFSVLLAFSWIVMILISGKERIYSDSVLNSKRFSVWGAYAASVSAGVAIALALAGIFVQWFFYASAAVSFVFIILQAYYFSRTATSFAVILTAAAVISFFPAYFVFYPVYPLASVAFFVGVLIAVELFEAAKNI